MKAITRSQWEALVRHEGPSVSVYLALHPQEWADQGDLLRLNQLADRAEAQLKSRGVSADQVQSLLKEVRTLPKSPRWKARRAAVAAFVSPATSQFLWLDMPVEPAAWGDACFHVRPLLPFVVDSDQFLLLQLSENHCTLFSGNSDGISRVMIDDLPAGITDARQANRGEQELQVHSMSAGGLGRRGAIFHGHGGQADAQAANWQAYLQQIATAIQRRFPQPTCPLVVATVEENYAAWQKTTAYPKDQQVPLLGNPDYLTEHELHDRGWQAASKIGQRSINVAYERYQTAKGTSRVRAGLAEVITAAHKGQVDTLFVDSRSPIPGNFDATAEAVQLANGAAPDESSDLIELAIRETVRHRGRVYPLEQISPTPALAEALLRY